VIALAALQRGHPAAVADPRRHPHRHRDDLADRARARLAQQLAGTIERSRRVPAAPATDD